MIYKKWLFYHIPFLILREGKTMKANYIPYNFDSSRSRIDDILNSSSNFDEKDTIPKREDLTFTNGYYVSCTSLFIDLRGSSQLTASQQKRVLAKIYRAYISEMVAIVNGSTLCREVNIVGDCVSAIFETKTKQNVREVFSIAAKMYSLIETLNYKLAKKKYTTIKAGIGIADGRVLMIKAGYSGSTINDVVWMGNAVNQASKMCGKAGGKEVTESLVLTGDVYVNLDDHQKGLLKKHLVHGYYYGDVYNNEMHQWLEAEKKKDADKNRVSW